MRKIMLIILVLSTPACSAREYYLAQASSSLTSYWQGYYLSLAQEQDNMGLRPGEYRYYNQELGSFVVARR